MRRAFTGWIATGLILIIGSPLLAQDEPTVASSWFRMFLWSDDIIGLVIIWLLLLMSAVSLGFTIKLVIDYRRITIIPQDTHEHVQAMLGEKRYREAIEFAGGDPSYLGRVVSAGLNEASNGYGAMERAIESSGDAEATRLLRPIEYLNVLGNIAPMMGLFGTVYGMIVAFQKLVESGGKPDPGKLAGGISTALVTTFWGLIVAMPALAGYALIRNKVDALTSEGLVMAEELIRPFKPGARKAASGGGSSGSAKRSRSADKPAAR
jgi:biopolymer transport protein ExbB